MAEEKKPPFSDPFVRQRTFPDAQGVFGFAPTPLKDALADAVIVVDTNALLVPYNTGRASIEQIRRTYERLASEDRLRIPGQVAREFAVHRAEKIKTVYQQLSRKRSTQGPQSEYPLLEGLEPYNAVLREEAEISKRLDEYRKAVSRLLQAIGEWNWDDPVSTLYRQVFTGAVVFDPPQEQEAILKDLKYRHEHLIPPGYKDAANPFSGIGDLLIWNCILEIGRQTTRHVVFVSGDEKTDWRYQSENQALYPRYELIDEFRRVSNGRSFHIIGFADLLREFGAPSDVVSEVRQEEAAVSLKNVQRAEGALNVESSFRAERAARAHAAELAVYKWVRAQHPRAAVSINQRGFPDFKVQDADRAIGYDVSYLYRSIDAIHRLARARRRVAELAESKSRTIGLVFVLDSESLLKQVVHAVDARGALPGVHLVSVGTIAPDGTYEERHRTLFDEETLRGDDPYGF